MLLNLTGKKALIIGVANQNSMWWSIAQQFHQAGATLGFTFLPDPTGKGRFEKKVKDAIASLAFTTKEGIS
jgi:enoyl-[acyl-carrier protein] reductase I